MPKREDIKTVLLIGSGPIVIGQACEFDYSGAQAAKTLKREGYRVVLVNSNPATIMTDPEFADRTYIEPLTVETISEIIRKEKVDAILPTMGGQTALNVAMKMHEKGLLEGVKFLGASPEAIKKGEDRLAFKEAMQRIGMDLAKSRYAYNVAEAVGAAEEIGFPLIIRASYTLAGSGSGVAYNIDEFKVLAQHGLDASPISEILVEESLLGWKEFEMEVIRDRLDNCIIICSIENLDPMGVHTGDSVTIAPALTLTDKEFQNMRDASFAILREIGVDTGGSNVQFAINPKDGRMTVIEMNPRVSRSSALASKATGYPIAKIATLLAVGYTLDELKNDITGTSASFEPTIDYIVVKMPRFNFEKFPGVNGTLTTSMKSVGEAMAIGATFIEAIQKALCSLETGICGFDPIECSTETIVRELRHPGDRRLLYVAQAFREGMSVEEIYDLSRIDRFFLRQIERVVREEKEMSINLLSDANALAKVKSLGFSDKMIARMLNRNEGLALYENDIYLARKRFGLEPKFCEVDTCAAEFEALTPYLYSVMPLEARAIKPRESSRKRAIIIGGGPNRIGQGIEFDYCCVHAAFALREMGVETIMVNCNPETISTDYDTSDVLYFEPIDLEHIRAIIEREQPDGIIVHFGGQTPLKLSRSLSAMGAKIVGTSAKAIDIAEDREKFSKFVQDNNLLQPAGLTAVAKEAVFEAASRIGYPVLVRPSYVLGGRGMRIVYDENELKLYVDEAVGVSSEAPLLVDKFLDRATELDVDAISDGTAVYIGGILEHIEEAGIHSGDSACSLPTVTIRESLLKEIEVATKTIALALGVKGLLNIQYAIHQGKVYLLEVNPRASRTVPFVSKATGLPLAKIATRVMWGEPLESAISFYDKQKIVIKKDGVFKARLKDLVALKEAVFPFNKLPGADLVLGPEMRSTGEVMGISESFGISFAKSQLASQNPIPAEGKRLFMSLAEVDKQDGVKIAAEFVKLGFEIIATSGTAKALENGGVGAKMVLKVSEGRPNVEDLFKNKEVDLAINTPSGKRGKEDARRLRQAVLGNKIPYFTTIAAARAALEALKELRRGRLPVPKALQEYLK
ncbi:MAG: carbamoyl-phosphate synthase large subunit [Helicobacteraceae bacterium]|jgi:carbamoyl-phosphate synthase large subunit|nr:carbamoyl-phosphate synthase large subunit [Helicobacteraceae bacterium]